MIRFKQDCDGYKSGETVTLEGGVEDAYVNYRGAAEFVKPEEATKGDGRAGRRQDDEGRTEKESC